MNGERSYTIHNQGAAMEGPGPSRQNGSHPPPLGKMTTGYNLTRSFMDGQLEQYRQKLPRRRRKRCQGCLSLSGYSWTFLVLALIQGELQTLPSPSRPPSPFLSDCSPPPSSSSLPVMYNIQRVERASLKCA